MTAVCHGSIARRPRKHPVYHCSIECHPRKHPVCHCSIEQCGECQSLCTTALLNVTRGNIQCATALLSSADRSGVGRVHSNRHVRVPRPEPSAGPFPVRRQPDKSSANRVGVDVLNDCGYGLLAENVVIKTSAWLPEPKHLSRRIRDGQTPQPIGTPLGFQVTLCLVRHAPLETRENTAHLESGVLRMDEQVHMLGHDHVGPDCNPQLVPHAFDRFDNPSSRPVFGEQRQPSHTGIGHEMGVTGFVPGFTSFSVVHGHAVCSRHEDLTPPHCSIEQWHTASRAVPLISSSPTAPRRYTARLRSGDSGRQ